MGLLLDALLHPSEGRALIHFKLWREPLHRRHPEKECSSLRRCYELLDLTSRSFSAVIQELSPELRDAVTMYYLALRALDTIEDDMTLPLKKKLPLLRSFYKNLNQEGWNFKENGPNEADRQLCVEFDVVIIEYKKLKPDYQEVIRNTTKEMGEGMAYYSDETVSVVTLEDYDKYCHYVAGLVGEGLSNLFAASGLEKNLQARAEKDSAGLMELSNSMGLFLQKTNIMRDYREDLDDGRIFWPKDIWSKYATDISDLAKPENQDAAIKCISEMTCNALEHATDCLLYLSDLRDQSVFNFCAIPQVMAVATLSLVFRNPDVFQKNVKIRKGQACQMINRATNLTYVGEVFVQNVRLIHRKNHPSDPNFLRISGLCGRVEQYAIKLRSRFKETSSSKDATRAKNNGMTLEEQKQADKDLRYVIMAVIAFWFFVGGLMIFVASMFGARYDLAWADLTGKTAAVTAASSRRLEEL